MTAEPIEIADEPTVLYRLFGVAGVLLYVGVSRNPAARFAQHAADKTWWPEVVKKTAVMYGSRREAEVAEGKAIRSESPVHNIAPGRSDPEARRAPVRKVSKLADHRALGRQPRISLDPFIRAYAANQKCSYAMAETRLIFAGIIQDYMDRFGDPLEGLAALEKDMDAQKNCRLPRPA